MNMLCRVLLVCSLVWGLSVHADETPADFTLTRDGDRYTLVAKDASLHAILKELGEHAGIAVVVDDAEGSVVSADLADVTLEELVHGIAHGYSAVYVKNEATGVYEIERIVAGGAAPVQEAGALDAAAVVQAIRDRVQGITRYRQDMHQTINMMGQSMTMRGTMVFDGDKMRMEMVMPPANMKQVIVSDGKTTYTHLPMMNMVQKIDNARVQAALGERFGEFSGHSMTGPQMDPFHGMATESVRFLGHETRNGERMYVLQGEMQEQMKRMMGAAMPVPERIRFWISVEDGMPRQSIFYGAGDTEMLRQEYTSVEVDPHLDPELFRFVPPEGAQVMDMTDSAISMMRAWVGDD